MFTNMKGRVKELNDEMKLAAEQKDIVLKFIDESSGKMPAVVLETLNQKVRQLDIAVKDCEIRLKTYE